MRLIDNFLFNDKDLTVKELTMEELATVLDEMANTVDGLDLMFDGRLPSQAVVESSGLDRDKLHKLTPSLLAKLWDKVEGVNPFFLKRVQKILGVEVNPPKPPANQ